MKGQMVEIRENLRRCEDDLESHSRAMTMLESEKLDLMEVPLLERMERRFFIICVLLKKRKVSKIFLYLFLHYVLYPSLCLS